MSKKQNLTENTKELEKKVGNHLTLEFEVIAALEKQKIILNLYEDYLYYFSKDILISITGDAELNNQSTVILNIWVNKNYVNIFLV